MYTAAVVLHLVVCFVMIASILLQAGKGAEVGAAFGGTSQTIFGSRGAGTFLSKVTIVTAAVFMLTSLGLALLSKYDHMASSVIDASSSPAGQSTGRTAPGGTTATTPAESSDTDTGDTVIPAASESPADDTAP